MLFGAQSDGRVKVRYQCEACGRPSRQLLCASCFDDLRASHEEPAIIAWARRQRTSGQRTSGQMTSAIRTRRDAIWNRRTTGEKLQSIANDMGVTRQRIDQIVGEEATRRGLSRAELRRLMCRDKQRANSIERHSRWLWKRYQRFWFRVDVRANDECWEWLGCRNPNGYGRVSPSRELPFSWAHHIAWILAGQGSTPTGFRPSLRRGELCVLHKCDRPPCCNPAHLFLGTPQDNARDSISKNRRPGKVARLSDEEVLLIRQAARGRRGNPVQAEMAERIGISQGSVSMIRQGKARQDVR